MAAPHEHETSPGVLLPGTVLDRYEILDLIGVGGMASVYRARHRQLGSIVALKVLVVDRPSIRRRVEREGRVAAQIHHQNLVSVTDLVSSPSGAPVLVLEYIAGPSLDRVLSEHRLTLSEIDLLVRGILRGVLHAHDNGVIHRDLKPANILLAREGNTIVPKLIDFGIVKLMAPIGDPGRTQAGQLMGTPAYMAPEQFSDASCVDVRADVWSLGVLMYELCTQRLPFGADEPQHVFERLVSGDYSSPRSLVTELPARMVRAIEGALQPDLAHRVADVRTLLQIWCGSTSDEEVADRVGAGQPFTQETLDLVQRLSPSSVRAQGPVSDAPDTTLREPAVSGLLPTVIAQKTRRTLLERTFLERIGISGVITVILLTAAVASAFGAFIALKLS